MWPFPKKADPVDNSYKTRMEPGRAANEHLIARAEGRIRRLKGKRERLIARGLDIADTDLAISRYERQLVWSTEECR